MQHCLQARQHSALSWYLVDAALLLSWTTLLHCNFTNAVFETQLCRSAAFKPATRTAVQVKAQVRCSNSLGDGVGYYHLDIIWKLLRHLFTMNIGFADSMMSTLPLAIGCWAPYLYPPRNSGQRDVLHAGWPVDRRNIQS